MRLVIMMSFKVGTSKFIMGGRRTKPKKNGWLSPYDVNLWLCPTTFLLEINLHKKKTCALQPSQLGHCDLWQKKCMNKSFWLSTGRFRFFIVQKRQPKTSWWQPKWFVYAFSRHELQPWLKSQHLVLMDKFSPSVCSVWSHSDFVS